MTYPLKPRRLLTGEAVVAAEFSVESVRSEMMEDIYAINRMDINAQSEWVKLTNVRYSFRMRMRDENSSGNYILDVCNI